MKHPISTTPGYVGGLVTGHVKPSHPLSVMCNCAACRAHFKAEADARGVSRPEHQTFSQQTPTGGK